MLKFRVGLVGAGEIGRLRAESLQSLSDVELVAVSDLDPDRAKQAAAASGQAGVRVETRAEAIFENADIDGVILATPPRWHEELGLACLSAGKHLLCEKPLATTVEGCEVLVSAAGAAGLTLATGFTLRQTPAARQAKLLVDSGAIGELDHVRVFHGHAGDEFSNQWVRDATVSGGGTLMDNGIHMIDMALWFLGSVEEVQGFASNRVWGDPGCEDNAMLVLRSGAGNLASVHSSWSEWRGYGYRVEVYGTAGAVRFGYPPMWLSLSQGKPGTKMKTRYRWFPVYQLQERLRGWRWALRETLTADTASWVEACRRAAEAPASGRDGLAAVRVAKQVEMIARSSQQGG